MTHPSNLEQHEPDPWFRDYVAGEMKKELRRGRRIARIRQFTIVATALGIGSSVGVASAQIRENSQRDSILDSAQIRASIDQTRLEVARQELATAQKRFDAGAIDQRALLEAINLAKSTEVDVALDALNVEEIRSSKLPPRDDLNAPLVGSRDFVKSRLQLRMTLQQLRLDEVQQQLKEDQRRFNAGAVDRLVVIQSDATLKATMADLALSARKLQLRDDYLAKRTTYEALSKTIADIELKNEYQVAASLLQIATERLDLTEKRKAVGAAQDIDVLRARIDFQERQLEALNLAHRLSNKRPD